MLLIRKDDIPVYHDKIIISKPGGILPIPPNFSVHSLSFVAVWQCFRGGLLYIVPFTSHAAAS